MIQKTTKDDDVENAFTAKRDKFSSFDTARKEAEAKNKKGSDKDKDETSEKTKNSSDDEDDDGLKLGDEASTIEQPEVIKVNDCFPQFCMRRWAGVKISIIFSVNRYLSNHLKQLVKHTCSFCEMTYEPIKFTSYWIIC